MPKQYLVQTVNKVTGYAERKPLASLDGKPFSDDAINKLLKAGKGEVFPIINTASVMVLATKRSAKAKFAPDPKYGGSFAERNPFGTFKKGSNARVMHNDRTAISKGSRDN